MAAVAIAERLGVPLTSLVAPAAVAGVAIGFGAQRIVQDILAGFFIVTERQYGFGDLIRLSVTGLSNPATGTVEDVTLRVTTVRTPDGEVVITPNGQINQVTNLSRDWARAIVDVPVPATADVNRVSDLLRRVGEQAYADPEVRVLMLDPPAVMGVQSIDVDHFQVRVVARTLPGKQFDVGRILRARIAAALRHEGINLPPTIDTADPTATDPIGAGPIGLVRSGWSDRGWSDRRRGHAAGQNGANLRPQAWLRQLGRVRTSTWILTAVFLVALAAYAWFSPDTPTAPAGYTIQPVAPSPTTPEPTRTTSPATPTPDRKATPTRSPSPSASPKLSAPPGVSPSPTASPPQAGTSVLGGQLAVTLAGRRGSRGPSAAAWASATITSAMRSVSGRTWLSRATMIRRRTCAVGPSVQGPACDGGLLLHPPEQLSPAQSRNRTPARSRRGRGRPRPRRQLLAQAGRGADVGLAVGDHAGRPPVRLDVPAQRIPAGGSTASEQRTIAVAPSRQ